MDVNPQQVFMKLQNRIAQLELDKAILESSNENWSKKVNELETRITELETKPKVTRRKQDEGSPKNASQVE